MLFDRPCSRVRALLYSLFFGNFGLTTLLHWGKGWQAIIPSCPAVTLFLCHVMEVYCYHSLWTVTSRVLSAPFTLDFVTIIRHKCFQVFNWVCRMLISFFQTSKSALQRCLRIHLDCLETYVLSDAQEQYSWFQACLKRCRGGPWGNSYILLGYH
jgi:hypothetical protein